MGEAHAGGLADWKKRVGSRYDQNTVKETVKE